MTSTSVPLEEQYPLHWAAFSGDVQGIWQAIVQYVDGSIAPFIDDCTPLVCAAREGKLEAAKLLVSLKANVNNKSSTNGLTALLVAAQGGHRSRRLSS